MAYDLKFLDYLKNLVNNTNSTFYYTKTIRGFFKNKLNSIKMTMQKVLQLDFFV